MPEDRRTDYAAPPGEAIDDLVSRVKFNADGLVATIAQQHDTGEVLMMAWMNADALRESLETGRVCYWSRSRQSFWRKGESSGQIQYLTEARLDCDGDTLLLMVDQIGVACHTGRRNCFFFAIRDGSVTEIADPVISHDELYGK